MSTVEQRLHALEEKLGTLLEDSRIGDSLGGPLPVSESFMGLRRVSSSSRYIVATTSHPVSGWGSGPYSADMIRAYPFYVATPANADRLSFHITTVASGGYGRMGIYNSSKNLYPTELVVDAGQESLDATGWRNIAFEKKRLTRGLKWIAILLQYQPVLTELPDNTVWAPLGRTTAAPIQSGWGVAYSYGALPDVYPEGGTYRSGTPLMLIRLFQ